jgi:hypothetical protein
MFSDSVEELISFSLLTHPEVSVLPSESEEWTISSDISNIAEILLKVELNIITLYFMQNWNNFLQCQCGIFCLTFIVKWNREKRELLTTDCFTKCCIKYTSPWAGFRLTTVVVKDTDCICKSNYHTITTAP